MPSTATILSHRKALGKVSVTDVNLGTYATGGVTVTPSQLQLQYVTAAVCKVQSASGSTATASCQFSYDPLTSKVKAFLNTNAETGNAADLSPLTIRITAFGG